MRCPSCGGLVEHQRTRFGVRHACIPCKLWSWGGKPLASGAIHKARRIAHAVFDPLWKEHGIGRQQAYRLLADELGVAESDAHMSYMSAELARQVPAAVARILARRSKE